MARTLTPTILSALSSPGAQPSLTLTSTDLMLRLAQLAATGRPAARTAALVTDAGTLLRAAVSQGADPNIITGFRIANPASATQWQAAGTVISSNALALAGCSLVQTGGTIRCFYVNAATNAIVYRDSSDDGQTWGAEQVALAAPFPGDTCSGITAASTTDVFSAWYTYPQAASYLQRAQYASGAWSYAGGSIGPASPRWGAVRGMMVEASQPTRVFLGGVQMRTQQSGIAAAATTFDGTTWTAWNQIQAMDSATNGLSHAWPAIHRDPAGGMYYAGINLQDDGSISGTAQNRLSIWKSADGITWSLVQTLGNVFTYEGHIIVIGGILYAFDNTACYTAPAALGPADLSADLLSLEIDEAPDRPARFTFTLANAAGQYTAIPQLRDNARLVLSLGYNGSVIPTHIAYIDALEYRSGPEEQTLVIQARDLLKFLDQTCPVAAPFSNGTVGQIAQGICALANVPLATLPATSQFGQTIPCFVILPGESWLHALQRLGRVYDFQITVNGTPAIVLTERSADDPSSWSYAQEALGIAWQRSSDQPNIVRVVGASSGSTNVFAEAIDTANLLSSGAHRYRQIVDRLCDTSAKCRLKAQLALRDDQTLSQTGALTVTLNPAHQLLDVLTLTDSRVGLSGQQTRIHAIKTTMEWREGRWDQELGLRLS